MTDIPIWFRQLKWSEPIHVAALNLDRKQIPDFTGCYVFTVGITPIAPGRVLYVGEAAGQSLRKRISTYLVALGGPTVSKVPNQVRRSRSHKGKGFILEMRSIVGDQGVYVRWVEYGANDKDIHILEASLIAYLNPDANDRIEEYRHELLGDAQRLDPRLIR
jgi:hypothetical protein